mmetsp:Transcript_17153/g.35668  ORF Transcript_17153/g.35668 Transcript_17153/m.35668 type:complete len:131 (-) Transcript_17153:219-611(-)
MEGTDESDSLSSTANSTRLSEEETNRIAQQYTLLKSEVQNYYGKLGALESDCAEHEVVARTIKQLPGEGRRCWQQVGGVLAERTVEEMTVILESNRQKIEETINKMTSDLRDKESKLNSLREKYNIIEKN